MSKETESENYTLLLIFVNTTNIKKRFSSNKEGRRQIIKSRFG